MKRQRGWIARAALLVASSSAMLSIAGTGVAFGAVQRHATTRVAPQVSGSATAECRPGYVVLAAGFASPGYDPLTANGGPLARFASMPAGKRGVTTAGFNFSNNDPHELDSFAYCGKREHAPKVRSDRVEVAHQSYESVTAECPRGSQAISGGFSTNRGVITLTSKRAGDSGWTVAGFNIDDSGNPGAAWLKAYVYCKSPGPTIVTEAKHGTVTTGFLTSNVRCPDGGRAVAGGFDGHIGAVGGQLTAAGALDSKRTADGRGWTTSSLSISVPSPATITTYAYCRA